MIETYITIDENGEILHYGTPHVGDTPHSGRYPWGTGEDPNQDEGGLRAYVRAEKAKGRSEADIASGLGVSIQQLRANMSIEKYEERTALRARAIRMKDHGYSNTEIGKAMGINESSVRALLDPVMAERSEKVKQTADFLKENADAKGYIDIGKGLENQLQISRTKLDTSLEMLKKEGYDVYPIYIDQLGTGKKTTMSVLAKEGLTQADIYKAYLNDEIKLVDGYSNDGGEHITKFEQPVSIDGKRVYIRYNEQGGIDREGVIQLRQGVEDLSLGGARYAQVRIGVDDKYYLKGMAMYGEDKDIPKGYDIVFNTNKHEGTPPEKVFKAMKDDKDNPFGASIKYDDALSLFQRHYVDSKTGETKLSPINVVQEEGQWGEWSKTLASQFLSKQPIPLAKTQLDLSYKEKLEEFNEISRLTNPEIKKKLLESYADACDSAAVHLKAAALPRQQYQVILPFPDIKDNEIYAPNFKQGETVVLIRYPHGGKFEIPQLTVNNKKGSPADKLIHNAADAVGINPKVAAQLSGADFDGDTVLVIPNNEGRIKVEKAFAGLKDFDPKERYKLPEGAKAMSSQTKQIEMGKVSNLITDMTLKGAKPEEIERAVKHSMVVIDAEKHKLDYKQSERDNGIAALKKKYQGSEQGGASTLISKASSELDVPDRRIFSYSNKSIDPVTGKKIFSPSGKTEEVRKRRVRTVVDPVTGEKTKEVWYESTGERKPKMMKSTKMYETDDARTLISTSNLRMENVYADYANKMKALGNQARKEWLATGNIKVDPEAKKTYAKEIDSLKTKLNMALKNAPLERQAQQLAAKIVRLQKANDEGKWTKEKEKKAKGRALDTARQKLGAKKQNIKITPREWEAIQRGAISSNVLNQILDNTDLDVVKSYATPRKDNSLTSSQVALARSMANAGYTQSEIAERFGVSATTISKHLKGTMA